MGKRKQKTFTKRLARIPVYFLVVFFFMLPLFLTGSWLKAVLLGNDTRHVTALKPLSRQSDNDSSGTLRPFSAPIISITFDDGWESVYSQGAALFQQYNVPTTQYILGDVFDNQVYLSEKQIKSMQAAGHEIASHTMTHDNLTAIDDEDLAWQLSASKKVLTQKFGPVQDFASPLGAYDARTIAAIKRQYRSHRNTEADPALTDDGDINTAQKFEVYNIKAYTVRLTTTHQDIQKLIDYTIKHNGWLVLTYHQVDDGGATYSVTPQMLEEHLRLITQSPIRIETVGRVLDHLPQSHTRVTSRQ